MTAEQGDDDELNVDKAATLLGVSRWTVRRTPRDELPYREVGAGNRRDPTRRYRREDVERLRRKRSGTAGEIEELKAQGEAHELRITQLERLHAEGKQDHP